jgi:hypothetical protein
LPAKFIERNRLFTIPYVVAFQAVKVSDDVMCVYNVGMFEFKDGSGYLERITVCQFVNSLQRFGFCKAWACFRGRIREGRGNAIIRIY